MKKIVVDKNDGIAEIVDRVVSEPDDEVIVVVPRGSILGKSARNFHMLKREAEAADKQIQVESVDEQILALATDAGLGGSHPLFRQSSASVSDIVSMPERKSVRETVVETEKKTVVSKKHILHSKPESSSKVRLRVDETEEDEPDAEDESVSESVDEPAAAFDRDPEAQESSFAMNSFFKKRTIPDDDDDDYSSRSGKKSGKAIGITIGVIVIVLLGLFVVTHYFGKAQISIDFKQTPWQDQMNFVADTSVSKINTQNDILPAQMFTEQKNITELFPATGSSTVSQKAQGTMTIYNAYSSASQDLVATTRFVAPDGKIFRLATSVTVPGAAVTNGQIVPSSITATVVADQPGSDYNEGPVSKLTIPGFQGSPKFAGFYGSLPNGTSGGFIGLKSVPTAQDIAAAEASTTAVLQASLTNVASMSIPANFKILNGATNVQVGKLSVSTSTDANGHFSVFGQATYQAIGFDEPSLEAFLLSLAQSTESSSTFTPNTLNISYSAVVADFTKGTLNFTLAATASLEPAFSQDDFKTLIAGQSIGNVQNDISSLPNLSDGKISVWPVWLWNVPSDPNKITITVK